MLTAERSLYSAEDALLQSRVKIVSDYIALNKALGGGWDGEVDALTPEVIDVDTGPHPALRSRIGVRLYERDDWKHRSAMQETKQ